MEHAELTGQIIAAAIEVHRELGPGFLESVYEHALALELEHRGLAVETQHDITIWYKGDPVGQHRLDIFVEDLIIVELKAIQSIEAVHFAILKAYLKAAGRQHGLILNFAKATLEVRRAFAVPPSWPPRLLASSLISPS